MHRLIEASAELIEAKDMQRGLDKAKEAGKGISDPPPQSELTS